MAQLSACDSLGASRSPLSKHAKLDGRKEIHAISTTRILIMIIMIIIMIIMIMAILHDGDSITENQEIFS